MDTPTIITTAPESRQVARVLTIDANHTPYIDWNKIAQTARKLGAHFEVRTGTDDALTVTFFWSYDTQAEPTVERADDWMYHASECASRRIGPTRGFCDCGAGNR